MKSEKERAYMKAYREKHKERLAEQNRVRCSARYYRDHEASKRAKREHYHKNRDKIREAVRKQYHADPAKFITKSVASAQRRKEHVAAYFKQWYSRNKNRQREKGRENYRQNAEAYKARAIAYGKANPGHRAAIARKRQAVKQACPVEDLKAVMAFYKMVRTTTTIFCHWCKKEIPKGKDRTVDHVVPIARGGSHAIANLVPACRSCNCSKSKKTPDEFYMTAGSVGS